MENDQSSITWFPRQEFSASNGIRDIPSLYQELKEPVETVNPLRLNAEDSSIESTEGSSIESAEISHAGNVPPIATRLNGVMENRTEKTQARASLSIEEDFYTLFEGCVPTDERLRELRKRWIDRSQLQRRLLYCQPFHIVFEEEETSRTALWLRRSKREPTTKLVQKSHHELSEFLQQGDSRGFVEQLLDAWPASFGQLTSAEGQPPHFRWQLGVPEADEALIICRKCLAGCSQDTFMMEVSLRPSDNVLCMV
ncbi:hypothetical protein F4803DRAFT_229831 [Xylaria telfairii]|nr:hypothetical protein F4803DRAFT_229831 [Xylaria telfairii]